MINYGFYKELDKSFTEAADIILSAIKENGFTIVTQIDLKEKFKEKLDKDYPNYTILGLCYPQTAFEAIQVEEAIGLFLPCNMVVFEKGVKTVVSLIKPTYVMTQLNNPDLIPIAEELERKLKKLFDAIK